MRSEIEHALDRGYAALNWWLEGLWIGLPERARGTLFAERLELVVRVAGDRATVTTREGEAVTVDTNDATARTALERLLPRTHAPDVTVLLPNDVVLTRALRMPAAVGGELRYALLHELDRLTPFAIEDIVFDYHVRERIDTALLVDVALIPRRSLDELHAKLEHLGLRPIAVTTEGAQGARPPLNLVPRRRRLRLPVARLSLRPALGISAALLLVAALYVPLTHYESMLASQAATVETVRAEAVAARARLTEQETALASGELLGERRSAYVAPVVLLRELTTQIPEHTWLSRLTVSRAEVLLQGESTAATELLQRLESTDLLRDVQFQAPVSHSDQSGKEQFAIVAKLARSAP